MLIIKLCAAFAAKLQAMRFDKRAVTAIEYALIAALIAVVIIGSVTSLGKGVSNTLSTVSAEL